MSNARLTRRRANSPTRSEQIRPDAPPKRKHPTTAGAVGCRMLSLFKLSCRVYGFYARPNRARCKRSYIWFRPLYVTRVTKWCDEGHKRPSSSLSFARSLRRHHKDFLPFDVSISVLDGRLIRRPAKDARRKCEPCLVRISRRRVWSSELLVLSLRCHRIAMEQPAESRKGLNLAFTRRAKSTSLPVTGFRQDKSGVDAGRLESWSPFWNAEVVGAKYKLPARRTYQASRITSARDPLSAIGLLG